MGVINVNARWLRGGLFDGKSLDDPLLAPMMVREYRMLRAS